MQAMVIITQNCLHALLTEEQGGRKLFRGSNITREERILKYANSNS